MDSKQLVQYLQKQAKNPYALLVVLMVCGGLALLFKFMLLIRLMPVLFVLFVAYIAFLALKSTNKKKEQNKTNE